MIYDNLDIRGLNRCSQYCQRGSVIDTFTRPDGPLVGTMADSGQVWEYTGSSDNTGVGGGQWFGGGGDGNVGESLLKVDFGALSVTGSVDVVGLGDDAGNFEISIGINDTSGDGGPLYPSYTAHFRVYRDSFDAVTIYAYYATGGGSITSSIDAAIGSPSFPTTLSFSIVPTSISMTYSGETITLPYPYPDAASHFWWVTMTGTGTGGSMVADNLHVDGSDPCADPNHPCYQDCSGSSAPTDTFTRTVASGWGMSDSGNEWTAYGSNSFSVDGSRGVTGSGNGGDGNVGNETLTFPTVPLTDISIDMDGTVTFLGTLSIGGYDSVGYGGIVLQYAPAEGTLHLNASSSEFVYGTDEASVALDVAAPNRWRVSYVGGAIKGKVWNTSGSEPGWQVSVTVDPISIITFTFEHANWASSEECYVYVDNLQIAGVGGCVDVMPDGSGQSTTNAIGQKACDQIVPLDPPETMYGDTVYVPGTRWQTTRATYIPGTTKLAVNGIFQFFKYLESDPDNGIITANIDIFPSDVVTLCYLSNGPLP